MSECMCGSDGGLCELWFGWRVSSGVACSAVVMSEWVGEWGGWLWVSVSVLRGHGSSGGAYILVGRAELGG